MAQHVAEPTALFPHLESSDLHTVKEFKALIQDNLTSAARDPSFLYALVDFYIGTHSTQAQDILAGIREPLDKPLLDKLTECLRTSQCRLPALTLLSHIVRRQPSWLHKIVQAPLFASLLSCLKSDTDIPILMCGILSVTTLLPMIPSQVGPYLHDIFQIFARLASWNVHKPAGDVHDVYQLHLQAAVYALFHRLYGMYPWNFLEFLQTHYASREKEFTASILPMLERVRMHPQLIVGQKAKETELSRWRKMEVHDILVECARVSLDTTESSAQDAHDDQSTLGLSCSETGSCLSHAPSVSRGNTSTLYNMASPANTLGSADAQSTPSNQQTPSYPMRRPELTSTLISSQAILSAMWSPSVDCGLTTPPTSHPPSPGGSMMDISLTSSLQMGYGDPSSSLTTPRDSPHSAIYADDQPHRSLNTSDSSTPNKSGRKSRGKVPGALQRHPQTILQRTTSAPSTPGYDAAGPRLPASPIRKYSIDRSMFSFGGSGHASAQQQQGERRGAENTSCGSSVRSRQSSGKGSGIEESVLEDSVEMVQDGRPCPKQKQKECEEDGDTSLSLKDLPNVIKNLPDGHPRSEDAMNAEVSSIVNSPQNEFVSQVIAGLHQHKEELGGAAGFLRNSTPKYKAEESHAQLPGHMVRGTAEGAEKAAEKVDSGYGMGVEEGEKKGRRNDVISTGNSDSIQGLVLNGSSPGEKAAKTVSQNLFGDDKPTQESAGGTTDERMCDPSPKGASGALPRQPSLNQRFTPIRDHSLDIGESPYMVTGGLTPASEASTTAAQQAYLSISQLFPLVLPHSVYSRQATAEELLASQDRGDDVSLASSLDSHGQARALPLHAALSPAEILDRHISMSDDIHHKELSRLPLTSQRSVNWTHYGGSPPADEINLLKGQVQLLHNQLLYERHKREVHAGRNRRLLGKTHKAKAYEELNSAMKDQLRLQENEVFRLSDEAKQLRRENRQLREECSQRDRQLQQAVQKLASEKIQLRESNEELNKLLVTHKLEVDKVKKELRSTHAVLFDREQELTSTKADIATNRHLKDEIGRLNKEVLLLGEANVKYKESLSQTKLGNAQSEEDARRRATLDKELADCHDAKRQKSVQLEASKARIVELEALLTQKERSIAEQKRYLESVKSLSNGKVEAMEAKYKSLKKVNQRLEVHILKVTKRLSEKSNVRSDLVRQRSNPDGAQLDDSLTYPGVPRSRSNSPQKVFDRRASTDVQGSMRSDKPDLVKRQTPLGDEGAFTQQSNSRGASGVMHQGSVPTARHALQHGGELLKKQGQDSTVRCPKAAAQDSAGSENTTGTVQSPAIRFSQASPFQRFQPSASAPANPAATTTTTTCTKGIAPGSAHSASSSSQSCPNFEKQFQVPAAGRTPGRAGLEATHPEGGQQGGEVGALTHPSEGAESSGDQPERTAVVDIVGPGVGSQGIASLLELDTSVEERGLSHW